jgi:hypothetical protein
VQYPLKFVTKHQERALNRARTSGSCRGGGGDGRKSRVEEDLGSEVDSPNLAREKTWLATALFPEPFSETVGGEMLK